MKIVSVTATTCVVPLPRPIIMGEIRFDAREYIVVEITADTGQTGIGFGMTRNGPVAAIVDRVRLPAPGGQLVELRAVADGPGPEFLLRIAQRWLLLVG